jgi:23S rRNA pseudouridine955/2504/2580 synthase
LVRTRHAARIDTRWINIVPQMTSQVSFLNVGVDEIGQRLDNWLLNRLKGVPRSRIYRLIRSGEVRVNKGRPKARQRLEAGDVVRIPPIRMTEDTGPVKIPDGLQETLSQAVLYQDADVLVLNKPAGLAVHSGSGVRFGVIDVARAVWGQDWQLVHRLDRETSGCLMLVRRRELQNEFQDALAANTVYKAYQALVHGDWPSQQERMETPLHKVTDVSGERRVRNTETLESDGRLAVSLFTVQRRFAAASLLGVQIETGRTHQIRVQTSSLNHPIVGDGKYGRRALDQALPLPAKPGLCLHAEVLRLKLGGRNLEVQADLPSGFMQVINALEVHG